MYRTARDRIAPFAFSPNPSLGTMRPSSLIPRLMFPRRRRSTSFCSHRTSLAWCGLPIKLDTYVVILPLPGPLVIAHRGAAAAAPATSLAAARAQLVSISALATVHSIPCSSLHIIVVHPLAIIILAVPARDVSLLWLLAKVERPARVGGGSGVCDMVVQMILLLLHVVGVLYEFCL